MSLIIISTSPPNCQPKRKINLRRCTSTTCSSAHWNASLHVTHLKKTSPSLTASTNAFYHTKCFKILTLIPRFSFISRINQKEKSKIQKKLESLLFLCLMILKLFFSHGNYTKSILQFILFITNYVQNQV
jgi:hypothetical protein